MTIYILDNNPKKTAEYLDDKSLCKMIRDIAQVLCNVHHVQSDYINDPDYFDDNIPLKYSLHAIKRSPNQDWVFWAQECKSNYLFLINLLWKLNIEYQYRDLKNHHGKNRSEWKILKWAINNIPDLPAQFDCSCSESWICDVCAFQEIILPLVMPKKHVECDLTMGLLEAAFKSNFTYSKEIQSYRNYYQAKLKQTLNNQIAGELIYPKWTNREQPEFIKL